MCVGAHQRLALECHSQSMDSNKYTPLPVQGQPRSDPNLQQGQPDHSPDNGQPYLQYLSTVRTQITCAKEVHDALMECSKKVGERGPLTMGAPLPPPSAAQTGGGGGASHGSMGPPPAPAPAPTSAVQGCATQQ